MTGAALLSLLACPVCRGPLAGLDHLPAAAALACAACGARYPVRGGIPILLPPSVDPAQVHDELDHAHGHKRAQAHFYDRDVAAEFELSRPHGAPEAYRWLIAQKFRRGVRRLPRLAGATAVAACCGSGMDAELLARAGARVVAVDISEGCARRAAARAERYGVDYLVVVGDVERLPLRDRAADISFVHDGLHHLADPLLGVRELARVARRAVSINEPADAFATAVLVRLGLALAREEAGNRVARLRAADVAGELRAQGFGVAAERYLMYYRHTPGAAMRAASHPLARPAYRAAVRAADRALGRWGNKLQVTAVRAA